MDYKVEVSNFDSKKHFKNILEIENAETNIAKEIFFKKIARDILKKKHFEKITEGPSPSKFQGVPFDFIALKDGDLSLIELKGSRNTFNYSSEVQYSRLFQVVENADYAVGDHVRIFSVGCLNIGDADSEFRSILDSYLILGLEYTF